MKDKLAVLTVVSVIALILVGVIWWNVSIWNECRADHSFAYCMRLISR